MHDNINISRELQETRQLFDNVLLTQARGLAGAGGGGGGLGGAGGGSEGDTTPHEEQLSAVAEDILKKVMSV